MCHVGIREVLLSFWVHWDVGTSSRVSKMLLSNKGHSQHFHQKLRVQSEGLRTQRQKTFVIFFLMTWLWVTMVSFCTCFVHTVHNCFLFKGMHAMDTRIYEVIGYIPKSCYSSFTWGTAIFKQWLLHGWRGKPSSALNLEGTFCNNEALRQPSSYF